MSFGFGFGLPHWQALSGGFSPASLFAGGAEGVWYDPSDYSTLFQDPAGTTPVTAVEQPVGLMLDKSKGLVLGSELIAQPVNFNAVWIATPGGTPVASGNSFTTSGIGGFWISVLTPGKTYQITVTGSTTATSGVTLRQTNTTTTVQIRAGFGSAIFTALAGYTYFYIRNESAGTTTVTSISVRELPGNHAISYNATTARPTLSARVNLLTYSEQFDNAAWVLDNGVKAFGSGSVVDAITAPDNTTTAELLVENNTVAGIHGVRQSFIYVAGVTYTFTGYFKEYSGGAKRYARIIGFDGGGPVITAANVDLATLQITYTTGSSGVTTIPLANGWVRCSVTWTTSTTGVATVALSFADSPSGTSAYNGDNTSGIYIWGADLRPANIGANVPAYQRIADANTYDTNGFPKYLYFAGVDDAMYTPANLNLSGTDKATVFAGVRKLSDATQSFITEFSANSNSNIGSFWISPNSNGLVAASTYAAFARGTASANLNQTAVSAAVPAPVTNVCTVTNDIAGDLTAIRLNGAASGTNGTGNKGSGNFGTYPLYIGARNNASVWLNGYLYGLTVVGAQLTTPQIESMESWTAQRTGITL